MKYMLVIIDKFSRWVEAANLIKFLTRKVIPRFRILSVISSDSGMPFVETVLQNAAPDH